MPPRRRMHSMGGKHKVVRFKVIGRNRNPSQRLTPVHLPVFAATACRDGHPQPSLENADVAMPDMSTQMREGAVHQGASQSSQKSYQAKRTAELASWKELRDKFLDVHIENAGFPTPHSRCERCGQLPPRLYRCRDCCQSQLLCQDCRMSLHEYVTAFHIVDEWKDGTFVQDIVTNVIAFPHQQECSEGYTKNLYAIDSQGRPHHIQVQFCKCEKEAITVLRLGLWPCTPTSPGLVVDTKLLDLLLALQLSAHMSVTAFCQSLQNVHAQIYELIVSHFIQNQHPLYLC